MYDDLDIIVTGNKKAGEKVTCFKQDPETNRFEYACVIKMDIIGNTGRLKAH